jgi:effector-binding domain-containing protein
MSLRKSGIEHGKYSETLVATIRFVLKERKELRSALDELRREIPEEKITGPAFCIYHFVTSVEDGSDVEVGFPVAQAVETDRIKTRMLPAMEVLSLVHTGSPEELGESYGRLFGCVSDQHGVISDEFCREVYIDSDDPDGDTIKLQFVIHDWSDLFFRNLHRVLGEEAALEVMKDGEKLTPDSTVNDRFHWTREAMEILDDMADEDQKYDILSSCAHIFPKEQIGKLRSVYEEEKKRTGQPLKGVDAVIEFMGKDPGWGEQPIREGNIIYSSKNPRNPGGYDEAETADERKRAYCFCPLVRNNLDAGMPDIFCYCGSGWYRQQWEGAIGKPVRIEIVESILRGNDVCRFAIHLPDEM